MIKCKCGFEITDKSQLKNVKITKFRFDRKSSYQYDHTGQCPRCGIEVIGVLTYKEQDIQEIIDKTLNG